MTMIVMLLRITTSWWIKLLAPTFDGILWQSWVLLCRYTGSGKTHTVLGSDREEGLYYKVGVYFGKPPWVKADVFLHSA